MKHPDAHRSRSAASPPSLEQLVELRDDLAAAKNTAAAAYMASMALAFASSERAALCEVTNACREKLEALILRFDSMLAEASRRPGKTTSGTPGNKSRRQGP